MHYQTRLVVLAMVALCLLGWSAICRADDVTYVAPTKENYGKLADEMEGVLRKDVLGVWFPRSIDNEHGGFYSNFDRQWNRTTSQGKFSVFQGRMTWVSAQIVMRRPDLKDQYLPYVQHGLAFLNDVMWDKQDGGIFWGVGDDGQISPVFTDTKQLYGVSFGLYGAAAAYQATNDPKALDLTQRIFHWIDEHAHDAKNGGYYEYLKRDGTPILADPDSPVVELTPVAQFPAGFKSMNTHIHLLESFSQAYEVWKDPTLHDRLDELLGIVRDKVSVYPGAMNLYFTPQWQAFPDPDSYGHDVETTFLLLEAANILGKSGDPATEHMARLLTDHALRYGWDYDHGGFFREGTTYGAPTEKVKDWWVQFEGLNTLLLMHEKYGDKTDVYFKRFQEQWHFITTYQIDHQYGGVYEGVHADGSPTDFGKAQIWTEAYHDGRSLLNVTERLRKMAQ